MKHAHEVSTEPGPGRVAGPGSGRRGVFDRRTCLGAAAAALATPVLHAAIRPVSSSAAVDRLGNDAVDLSPARLLQAYIRLRGSLDGSVTAGWLDSLRYVVIDGVAHPFCRVLAGALGRYERKSEALYEATTLEITHYLDFHTGELLDTFTMPVTNRLVKVPPYRFGPARARFAVQLDEREPFSPQAAGNGADSFAPLGDVRLRRAITEPRRTGTDFFVRHEEIGALEPKGPGLVPVTYREWTIWRGPAAVALDPTSAYCPSELSYTAVTSWRPWMQMQGVAGHTLDSGRGAKARRFAELPARYLELTERLHPDVIRDPDAALLGRGSGR